MGELDGNDRGQCWAMVVCSFRGMGEYTLEWKSKKYNIL